MVIYWLTTSQNHSVKSFYLFLSCLYYSVISFTTIGYGDFMLMGISNSILAVEIFTVSFTIALLVVAFVKNMTR